ncbi:MAG TPA: hypothetical protein VMB50_20720 [Myxococcales bacterium]|nr:hypothetical protein [Myxococcales bacterium]
MHYDQEHEEALTDPGDFELPYGKTRKESYPLEDELSKEELEKKRLRLGKLNQEREKLATEHAAEVSKWKEAHKKLEAEFNQICNALGTGKEARLVKCEWEVDVKKKVAHLKRLDTKEYVFKNRKLLQYELEDLSQETMDLGEPPAVKNGAATDSLPG